MSLSSSRLALGRLTLASLIVVFVAACDNAGLTNPTVQRMKAPPSSSHDLSDTLNCKSGYVVAGGEVQCL